MGRKKVTGSKQPKQKLVKETALKATVQSKVAKPKKTKVNKGRYVPISTEDTISNFRQTVVDAFNSKG